MFYVCVWLVDPCVIVLNLNIDNLFFTFLAFSFLNHYRRLHTASTLSILYNGENESRESFRRRRHEQATRSIAGEYQTNSFFRAAPEMILNYLRMYSCTSACAILLIFSKARRSQSQGRTCSIITDTRCPQHSRPYSVSFPSGLPLV